jgi:hypothetical protein
LRGRGFEVVNFLGIPEFPPEKIEEQYWEGQENYKLHRQIERNSKLAQAVKALRLQADGDLYCEVCGFSRHTDLWVIGT